ncbi:hypothetical protein C8F04DRAFT_1300126 [Mycena alexandri]|uniref:C2H2-type domain-containing protein n=1 Tax=Mycena alexandri TaxID=1745969 RepID=A0AAD6SCK3_9AGAR|nr:hypothetical protein C8F04DRAFT_1300126 [Mycena alexandri]
MSSPWPAARFVVLPSFHDAFPELDLPAFRRAIPELPEPWSPSIGHLIPAQFSTRSSPEPNDDSSSSSWRGELTVIPYEAPVNSLLDPMEESTPENMEQRQKSRRGGGKVHICPHPSCKRGFSFKANMNRHYRTRHTMQAFRFYEPKVEGKIASHLKNVNAHSVSHIQ